MPGREENELLPERVTMGLLPYINAHALDEDYAQAAARRARIGTAKERPKVGKMGAAALAVFAVLTVTAAAQTSQDSVSEEKDRLELIKQVRAGKEALKAGRDRVARLSAANDKLVRQINADAEDSTGLLAQIELLNLRSGTVPVRGPGVEVVVDDAPNAANERFTVLDTDLQKLVNGLWQAGAEAISINGQRLTVLSAIRYAGSAITVNFQSLRRPYKVLAIGDANTLPTRFAESSSGQTWLDLQRDVGLRFAMRTKSTLRLPGASIPVLRFANVGQERQERKELP